MPTQQPPSSEDRSLTSGQPQTAQDPAQPDLPGIPLADDEVYADITASTAAMQQTWSAVTQSITSSMLDAFNQINALIWGMVGPPLPRSSRFNIREEGDSLLVTSDLPGYAPEHLHVEIRDGQLLISGERSSALPVAANDAANDGGGDVETSSGQESFHESLPLSRAIDSTKVEAELTTDGRLRITLPILQTELEAAS